MTTIRYVTYDVSRCLATTRSRPPLIVIPAHNEQETVASVVREAKRITKCQVLVVDDCSSDATAQRAKEVDAIVVVLPVQLGAWGATQTGFRYALRRGFRRVVTIDADGQHRLTDMMELVNPIEADQADVCIGICPQRISRARSVAWTFFKSITGLNIEDLTSGYRIYNERAMKILTSRSARFVDYQDVGVLLLLRAAGLRVMEVDVEMFQRRSGGSRIYNSWYAVARYMTHTLIFCVGKWSGSLHLERYRKLLNKRRDR